MAQIHLTTKNEMNVIGYIPFFIKSSKDPAIFIDGRLVRERSFDNIQKMIDEELQEKDK